MDTLVMTMEVVMKTRVIPEECIACGLCADVCPAVFVMGDDTAEAVDGGVPPGEEEAVREAAESCPTEAIAIDG